MLKSKKFMKKTMFCVLIALGWGIIMSAIMLPGLYDIIDYRLHHHGITTYGEWYVKGPQHILLFLSGIFVGLIVHDLEKSLIIYILGLIWTIVIMWGCLTLPAFVGVILEEDYPMLSFTALRFIFISLLILPLIETLFGHILGFFLSEFKIFQD